jgi:hypothetical protein
VKKRLADRSPLRRALIGRLFLASLGLVAFSERDIQRRPAGARRFLNVAADKQHRGDRDPGAEDPEPRPGGERPGVRGDPFQTALSALPDSRFFRDS